MTDESVAEIARLEYVLAQAQVQSDAIAGKEQQAISRTKGHPAEKALIAISAGRRSVSSSLHRLQTGELTFVEVNTGRFDPSDLMWTYRLIAEPPVANVVLTFKVSGQTVVIRSGEAGFALREHPLTDMTAGDAINAFTDYIAALFKVKL